MGSALALFGAVCPAQTTMVRQRAVHVLDRITGGHTPDLVAQLNTFTAIDAYITAQTQNGVVSDNFLVTALLQQLSLPLSPTSTSIRVDLRKALLARLIWGSDGLRNLMVHFWNRHVSIGIPMVEGFFLSQGLSQPEVDNLINFFKWRDLDYFRLHALGSFRDLLHHSAKSPLMLVYLNLYRSSEPEPNEDYARELLELHTMGPVDGTGAANYSQADIQLVSEVLAGWTVQKDPVTLDWNWVFDVSRHNPTQRHLFVGTPHEVILAQPPAGQEYLQGEALLDHLAGATATKEFVCRKLLRYFLADDAPAQEPLLLAACVNAWGSAGDIQAVLQTLLQSSVFKGDKYRRARARLPVEFVCALPRALDAKPYYPPPLNPPRVSHLAVPEDLLMKMGEDLLSHPTPDGFPTESDEQTGSGAYVASVKYARRILDGLALAYAFDPVYDLATVVGNELLPGESPNSPNDVARAMMSILFGRSTPQADRDRIRDVISKNGSNVSTPLNVGNPADYQERLARGFALGASFATNLAR